MRRLGRTIALLCTLVAFPAHASPVQTFTLENGLTVLLAPDSGASAVDVAVWYRTGSRTEPNGRAGITHLMERLMFRGTTKTPSGDFRRLLMAEGATVNTYTTPDYTSFYEVLPPPALDLALRLEADRMANLKIEPAAIDQERAYVQRERRSLVESNPVARAAEQLYATAFPGDGYGRSVLGSDADLARIVPADLATYYRERYRPGNALLTIVGNFDPAGAAASVRKTFGSLPARAGAPPSSAKPPPPLPRGRRIAGPARIVAVGWRTPPPKSVSGPVLELLSGISGEGTASRLQNAIVAPGDLIYQARTGFDARRDGSLFYVLASVHPDVDSTRVEQALTAEIERFANEPVSTDELDCAKRGYEAAWLLDQQTVRGRARALGAAQLVEGDYRAAREGLEALRNLTPADLLATARRVFRPEVRSVVWMVEAPGAPGEGGRR